MNNCCNRIYSVGCFPLNCECIDTGVSLTEEGDYTVIYWYNSAPEVQHRLTIAADGTGTLVLPPIFNFGEVRFKIYAPSGGVVTTLVSNVFDISLGRYIMAEADCFRMILQQVIIERFRPCANINCSNCAVDHGFTMSQNSAEIEVEIGVESSPISVGFEKESCCQTIKISNILASINGVNCNPPIKFLSRADYSDGFTAVADLSLLSKKPDIGDIITILVSFIGVSKKGLDNEDCITAPQTFTITITVI